MKKFNSTEDVDYFDERPDLISSGCNEVGCFDSGCIEIGYGEG